MAPENDVARSKLKVVFKRRKTKTSARKRQRSKRGLPSFQPRADADAEAASCIADSKSHDVADDEDDELLAHLACDTLLAIQSLHQSNNVNSNLNKQSNHQTGPSCLEIPVEDGGPPILGVLECQLHEFFTKTRTGGSSSTVSHELDELLRNNTLRRLSNTLTTNQRAPITVYVFTHDYQRAARSTCSDSDSDDQNAILLDWFLHNLQHWTASRISHAALQQTWRQHPPQCSYNSCDAAVRWLQDRQLLHAATVDHTHYQLWLPQWGRRVLPAVLQAKTDALAFLQQGQHRERSAASVVQRLRRHPVPAHALLFPWFVEHGWVRRVNRPSGPALQFLGK